MLAATLRTNIINLLNGEREKLTFNSKKILIEIQLEMG